MKNKKFRKRNKLQILLFSIGLLLVLAPSALTEDLNHENDSFHPKIDAIELDPVIFHLSPSRQDNAQSFPKFTLRSDNRYPLDQSLSSEQVNDKIPSKISQAVTKKTNRLENILYTTSLLTLTALNIADYISTVRALQLPGFEEGNPILRPLTKNVLLFSAAKIGVIFLDCYLLKKIHDKNKVIGWALSIAGNFAMSYIVANNIRKIHSVTGQ